MSDSFKNVVPDDFPEPEPEPKPLNWEIKPLTWEISLMGSDHFWDPPNTPPLEHWSRCIERIEKRREYFLKRPPTNAIILLRRVCDYHLEYAHLRLSEEICRQEREP